MILYAKRRKPPCGSKTWSLRQKKDALAKMESRITELDSIIKRLFEDNFSEKISNERFIKLSCGYEQEQDNLKAAIEAARTELKERERSRASVKSCIAAAKKYTDLQELDAAVSGEFIDRIYIFAADKSAKTKIRKIKIVYNFIGAFDFRAAAEQTQNQTRHAKIGIA